MAERKTVFTFIEHSGPEGSDQVVITVFRDVIYEEFHCDQVEGLCPTLIKLLRNPKQVAPVSILILQFPSKENNRKKNAPIHLRYGKQPRCQEFNLFCDFTGLIYPRGEGVIQLELHLGNFKLFL